MHVGGELGAGTTRFGGLVLSHWVEYLLVDGLNLTWEITMMLLVSRLITLLDADLLLQERLDRDVASFLTRLSCLVLRLLACVSPLLLEHLTRLRVRSLTQGGSRNVLLWSLNDMSHGTHNSERL